MVSDHTVSKLPRTVADEPCSIFRRALTNIPLYFLRRRKDHSLIRRTQTTGSVAFLHRGLVWTHAIPFSTSRAETDVLLRNPRFYSFSFCLSTMIANLKVRKKNIQKYNNTVHLTRE